jgi:hypothetical protein
VARQKWLLDLVQEHLPSHLGVNTSSSFTGLGTQKSPYQVSFVQLGTHLWNPSCYTVAAADPSFKISAVTSGAVSGGEALGHPLLDSPLEG